MTRTFAGYSWPRPYFPGRRNIEVTYVAGYNPIPPDIWIATVELVAHWWRNTQQASRTFTPNQEYDPTNDAGQSGLWQGMPYRVENLIAPYRKVSIG